MKIMTAEELVRKARSEAVMEEPFWGSILLHLLLKECKEIPLGGGMSQPMPTMGTDGLTMFYNPDFVLTTAAQDKRTGNIVGFDRLVGVCCHEAGHVLFGHHWRFVGKCKTQQEHQMRLLATDFSINPMIRDAGKRSQVMKLPDDAVYPGMRPFGFPEGLSAEDYFNRLKQWAKDNPKTPLPGCSMCAGSIDMPGSGNGKGEDGKNSPSSAEPEHGRTPTAAEMAEAQANWRNMVQEAVNAAKLAGKMPGGMDLLIGELHKPSVNWKDVLMRFMREQSKDDYRLFPPNRKVYGATGLYLPSLHADDVMGEIVFFGDMSGSTSVAGVRESFLSEAIGCCEEVRPRKVHFIGFDTDIHNHAEYTMDQFPISPNDIGWKGNGGTCFLKLFGYLKDKGIEPAAVIILTDMYGDGWPEEQSYPVLWAATSDVVAPMGETVRIETEE